MQKLQFIQQSQHLTFDGFVVSDAQKDVSA